MEESQEGTPIPMPEIPDLSTENLILPTDEIDTPVEEPIDEPVVEEVDDEPIATAVQDPGEFQPQDYSFDVTVYDKEGKNGKTVTIDTPEKWYDLLSDDTNLGDAKNLMKAQNSATLMQSKTEADKQKWEEKKKAYDDDQQSVQQREEATNTMGNEIAYLESKKELPSVEKKYIDADWSDPEVAKQPGIKERIELLDYMAKENKARAKAGLKMMTSVLDAHNAFRLDQSRKQASEQKKRSVERRKEAGARVAGTSPNPNVPAPKGIVVGRPSAVQW